MHNLIENITHMLLRSSFKRDAGLIERHTGISLDKATFDMYRKQGTIRSELGSDGDIHSEYYGFGIPMEQSSLDVMNTVLQRLADRGVVFNIDEDGNNQLFERLLKAARTCLVQQSWPRICKHYRSSPRLNLAVKELRAELGLPELDTVL